MGFAVAFQSQRKSKLRKGKTYWGCLNGDRKEVSHLDGNYSWKIKILVSLAGSGERDGEN